MKSYDVIILGGGPAGLTAGIYLARARQKVLILDQGTVGGQVMLTHAVANYPGLPELSGYKLASEMRKQAVEFGCEVLANQKIDSFHFKGEEKIVTAGGTRYTGSAVIIAVGGQPRKLGIESEKKFQGLGISYCATCDGDFFTGEDIVVVGGGNSALEEAVSLTAYAKSATVVHQFDHFQAYAYAVKAAQENPKISFLMESEVVEFIGEENLSGVRVRNKKDGTVTDVKATGAFIFIGYSPRSEMFEGCVSLNTGKEILTAEDMSTNVPGVFAAGDVRQKRFRQITTAVSDGTIAALSVMDYLSSKDKVYPDSGR